MKSYLTLCLSFMLLLTDQHLITKLSTPTSGKNEIADGAIDLTKSPEKPSIHKPTYMIQPSTQSSLFAHDEHWKLQRLASAKTQAKISGLTLFPSGPTASSADNHVAYRETLDESLLPMKKRFRTFTFDNQLERQDENNAIRDPTPNTILSKQDKQHPTEIMVPKDLHSDNPNGNFRELNEEPLEISGFVHPVADHTESPGMNGEANIRGASPHIATPPAFQLLKKLIKDKAAGTSNRLADNSNGKRTSSLINYINQQLCYREREEEQHPRISQTLQSSVQIADELLFHEGKPNHPSTTEILKKLKLEPESDVAQKIDDSQSKYRRKLTKSVITFTLLSISLFHEDEDGIGIIDAIVKELESLYNEIKSGQHTDVHQSQSWKNFRKELNEQEEEGNKQELQHPTRMMGLAWQIVTLLMKDRASHSSQNPANSVTFINQRLTQAINKIIFFSRTTNHVLS
ncbi:hypothetical protein PCASD_12044 [Puccinia coronata f. sp. avenae]|uniref:Uncharacterized protein n=1 Tax=Puccinia coronata f. sp. avenae TaxID=200324 RepID=A0A2N5TDD3_9BASI|nr:hypothetical protein PCASD_12044 [Puccinia coronata f. sp. avenae]